MKKVYVSPTIVDLGKAVDKTQAKCLGGYPECGSGDCSYYKERCY
ncbi:hypothetical protein EV207_107106 [Scopulibacillus darangshiensis]|uniref:Uncharacterized protein n=1 Tax=Scopulibacillus darangshiensis TaxID=442528 RepID=A0A4R2P5F2_9BACL|nr:hypothetical protein EV207_107106 [Scopulibacillus darangshiensis]